VNAEVLRVQRQQIHSLLHCGQYQDNRSKAAHRKRNMRGPIRAFETPSLSASIWKNLEKLKPNVISEAAVRTQAIIVRSNESWVRLTESEFPDDLKNGPDVWW
jgi:hypothetical protein